MDCRSRIPIITHDGSHSIAIPELNVTYHSVYGAILESQHVFIDAGLKAVWPSATEPLRILEMGFGTGLNALLTLMEAEKQQKPIYYTAIESFPLESKEAEKLNYYQQLHREDLQAIFQQLHKCKWEKEVAIASYFVLNKFKIDLQHFTITIPQHLVYFDAFAPSAQPELWTREIFEKLYDILAPGAILVTYCSKGDVRRAMQSAGFSVEKIPGPPGKREMIRAKKINEE